MEVGASCQHSSSSTLEIAVQVLVGGQNQCNLGRKAVPHTFQLMFGATTHPSRIARRVGIRCNYLTLRTIMLHVDLYFIFFLQDLTLA